MMVSNRGSMLGLLRWQANNVALYAGAGFAVVVFHEAHNWFDLPRLFEVPTLPVAVVGGALGIFVSFRTNTAYERWWDGRKLWGRLINTSRHWSTQVVSWVRDPVLARELVQRQIAYVHTLRVLLRQQDLATDRDVQRWLTADERATLASQTSPTHALLQTQSLRITALADAGLLTEQRLQNLDNSLLHLLDIQGGCERIKKTPLPRGYGYIAEQLIRAYSVLLPFAIVEELVWLTIPINVLICLSFSLISEAGRVLEDPFTLFWNGLALQNMSSTIEVNLLNRLGDTDLPPIPGPDENGILM
jgi:putative membrane protein